MRVTALVSGFANEECRLLCDCSNLPSLPTLCPISIRLLAALVMPALIFLLLSEHIQELDLVYMNILNHDQFGSIINIVQN